ncbi:MAG TPA: endonuclease MutS2 [Geobacteraceae bacterium]|nr:endonuclease MutS2 [Geobacteraceae bacterium]
MNTAPVHLLEFDKILDRIAAFTHSDISADRVLNISPLGSREEIELRYGQVEEIRQMNRSGISLPLYDFADIRPILELARPAGAVLGPLDLAQFLPVLRIAGAIRKQLDYRDDIPLLTGLGREICGFPDIREALDHAIAPDGDLMDTASTLLFELRRRTRQLTVRVRKRLEEIVREREVAIFLQDDFITQRNGRWVIPVRMDSKGMVPGVVHDVSNSGETAFMEPIEVIGMVNELENLHAEEKAEQIRILREFTSWIRKDADGILADFNAIVEFDRLNAIASFADLIGASRPRLSDDLRIDIRRGHHPLLLLMQRERGGKEVVPLDLTLGGESAGQVLLITGPNTGGKTIAIKSAGLLMLMAQAGIPVPADGESIFPASATLLADIGDEQSIEESLSTFSAHISKIASILRQTGERTIVLLDELGTGTDPTQGAALACGILADLMDKGYLVLATTHLIDIVAFVQRSEGMVNGAMEFDRKTLTPGYRLTIGEPGQSHALDIARRCGLPERVLDTAERMVGRMESDFHSLLHELKELRHRHEQLLKELDHRERQLSAREAAMAAGIREVEARVKEARAKGLQESKELVQSARKEINRILEDARKEKSRTSVKQLAEVEERLDSSLREASGKQPLEPGAIRPGSLVYVRALGTDATVLNVDHKHERLRVKAGAIEIDIPFSGVEQPRGGKQQGKSKAEGKRFLSSDAGGAEDKREINLIGTRVEDAIPLLDRFLDQVALNGWPEARIIHGKGTGNLMRGVREYLARHPQVAGFRPGEPYEGGDGATVVTMR